MAIAFDAATDGGNNGGSTTSLTFSHTCTGANRCLTVLVEGDDNFGTLVDDITGVTYAGAAMTFIGKRAGAASNDRMIYLYQLLAPASGANNVVISASGIHYLLGNAVSHTDVGSLGPNTTNVAGAASTTPLTTSLTATANNCWAVLGCHVYDAGNPPVAGTGLTRRTYGVAFGNLALFDSNGGTMPNGSAYSMTTTTTGTPSGTLTHVAGVLVPFVAAVVGSSRLVRQAVNRAATF